MPKIEVINTETGEHLLVEKIQYYRQLRKRGIYTLPEEYEDGLQEERKEEVEVVKEDKRGRGRPRKEH